MLGEVRGAEDEEALAVMLAVGEVRAGGGVCVQPLQRGVEAAPHYLPPARVSVTVPKRSTLMLNPEP